MIKKSSCSLYKVDISGMNKYIHVMAKDIGDAHNKAMVYIGSSFMEAKESDSVLDAEGSLNLCEDELEEEPKVNGIFLSEETIFF